MLVREERLGQFVEFAVVEQCASSTAVISLLVNRSHLRQVHTINATNGHWQLAGAVRLGE